MLKIERIEQPVELTEELRLQLTEEFKETDRAVWKDTGIGAAIEQALLEMSHSKCCYCECKLQYESNYLHVEHFYPKAIYKDEVLIWVNLLPCCPSCNTTKGGIDTKTIRLIKPDEEDPRIHLALQSYFLKGKDKLGSDSINKIDLNNFNKRIKPRRVLTEEYQVLASLLLDSAQAYASRSQLNGMQDRKNRIIDSTTFILNKCIPSAIYSAYNATRILNDTQYYHPIKTLLQKQNIWTPELANLEQQAQQCALDYILS